MKDQNTIEKTKALLETNACPELKAAAKEWLDSNDSDKETEQKYVSVLKGSVMKIDDVIAFFKSEAGIAKLGAETAAGIAAHGEEIKAKGAVYCDCPACSAALDIIKDFEA